MHSLQDVLTLLSVGTQDVTDDELIKKKDIFDPIEDDDDWKHNPFDVDSVDDSEEVDVSDQTQGIGSRIHRCIEVEPMKIVIVEDKWQLPCNRAPPRKHSEEKQKEIRKQVVALLELEVIKESRATKWSQVSSAQAYS